MTRAREREVMTRPVNRRRMETARRSEEVISGGENVGKGRRDDVPRTRPPAPHSLRSSRPSFLRHSRARFASRMER